MGKQSRRKKELRASEVKRDIIERSPIQPRGGICDFCSSPDVEWAYLTDSGDPTEPDERGWSACDICHDLIERGQHEALARRSTTTMIEKYPTLSQLPFNTLLEHHREFHREFREHRVGKAITDTEFRRRYGALDVPLGGMVQQFMAAEGLDAILGHASARGETIARPSGAGAEILHRTSEGYEPEGLTAEQLTDPRTVEYLMKRIEHDRPTPNIPLTVPIDPVIREWVGARTYKEACAAVYGETPRSDDIFVPKASMMLAQIALEPILGAHPIVLEPEQMNAIDEGDWSFAEANDYAKMAHLPFEPVYIDFGGFEPVMVDLEAGPCRLYGAVVWRSGFFKTPTLAVAPIGGFEYLTGPLADRLLAEGIDKQRVIDYVGKRPGKEVNLGDPRYHGSAKDMREIGISTPTSRVEFDQWKFQSPGICWFGVKSVTMTPEAVFEPYIVMPQRIIQDRGPSEVPMVYSTEMAIADATDSPIQRIESVILTGMWSRPVATEEQPQEMAEQIRDWATMMRLATEMVAKLAERALLGLYFIESAPIQIEEATLTRPERREQERKKKKGKTTAEIASIVVIRGSRSVSSPSDTPGSRNYTHRWERRGYTMHLHSNNRHYQNRPDLVEPCHRCAYQYEENEKARREGKELPYPTTESPDCIKKWILPTVCGPEHLALKKKVRIRRADHKDEEAA